jgi:Rrf2 family nitric oxide-sensitive transcriptional repressor
MRLTLHADYALRVLLYLGQDAGPGPVPTERIAGAYGISRHHLVRVVQGLAQHGHVEVRPGRAGGVLLARPPREVRVGDVVRQMEPDLDLVECFDRTRDTCRITPGCALKAALAEARRAFLSALDGWTLEDLLAHGGRQRLAALLVG